MRSMLARFAPGILASCFVVACSGSKAGVVPVAPTPGPVQTAKPPGPAPDYSTSAAWMSLPATARALNGVPAGFSDLEPTSDIDVFYIYPTTAVSFDNLPASFGFSNATYDDAVADGLAYEIAANQAGAFNGTARIFAPNYRQVVMDAWFGQNATQIQPAAELAYQDVKRAFDYYLSHYNQSRPIIVVGHSQGSMIGLRLLKDEFDNKPAFKQLVAAYLAGQGVDVSTYHSLAQVHPCTGPLDTGCVNNWGSFRSGIAAKAMLDFVGVSPYWASGNANYSAPTLPIYQSMNPITWSSAAATAPASQNVGPLAMLIPYPPLYAPVSAPYPMGAITATSFTVQTYGARTDALAIGTFISPDPPPSQFAAYVPGIIPIPVDFDGVWHLYDFNLYWTNIRQNARDRSNAFLKARGDAKPLIAGPVFGRVAAGVSMTYQAQTVNGASAFSATGLDGLEIDPETGIISGTPSAGTYSIVITATNSFGSSSGELALVAQ